MGHRPAWDRSPAPRRPPRGGPPAWCPACPASRASRPAVGSEGLSWRSPVRVGIPRSGLLGLPLLFFLIRLLARLAVNAGHRVPSGHVAERGLASRTEDLVPD